MKLIRCLHSLKLSKKELRKVANYEQGRKNSNYYVLGHCSVIVVAGTCTELVQRYMNWNEKSRGAIILKKICGVLVLIGGLYLIFIAN